jgi:hypothetical protein
MSGHLILVSLALNPKDSGATGFLSGPSMLVPCFPPESRVIPARVVIEYYQKLTFHDHVDNGSQIHHDE